MHLLDRSGNPKYTDLMRDEISTKSVVRGKGGDISSNVQSFTFSVGPHQRWKPELSSWVMRIRITNIDGATQLTEADNIAPAINAALNGWQYIHCYAGNQKIDELSEHVAEVASIRTRLEKSQPWYNSIGRQQFWDTDFNVRRNKLISDGPDPASLNSTTLVSDFAAVPNIGAIVGQGLTITGTNTITLAASTLVVGDNLPLQVGDVIEFNNNNHGAANNGRRVMVSSITSNLVFTVNPVIANNVLTNYTVGDITITQIRESNLTYANSMTIPVENGRDEYEIQFKLPLGICYLSEMPTGEYEFRLRGFSYDEFARRFIESLQANKSVARVNNEIGKDFLIEVKDLFYHPFIAEAPTRMDDGVISKTFKCYEAQKKKLLATSNQLQYTIKGNSSALGFALQDGRIGNDSRYSASRMVAYNDTGIPNTGVRLNDADRIDTQIDYYQIRYANKYRPEPAQQDDLASNANRTLRIVQSYYDTYKNSGAFFYDGVMETLEDYLQRGPIYFWQWPRDRNTYATEARIDLRMKTGVGSNVNCVFFYCFYRTIKLTIKDGQIVSVEKNI
jgi:hypothetical protein